MKPAALVAALAAGALAPVQAGPARSYLWALGISWPCNPGISKLLEYGVEAGELHRERGDEHGAAGALANCGWARSAFRATRARSGSSARLAACSVASGTPTFSRLAQRPSRQPWSPSTKNEAKRAGGGAQTGRRRCLWESPAKLALSRRFVAL